MAGTNLAGMTPGQAVILPADFYNTLITELQQLRQRVERLEGVSFAGSDYLSREQAMSFLHCGATKLWMLKNDGSIKTVRNGARPLYCIKSCREYLEKQGYSQEAIAARFDAIIAGKKRKKIL